MNIRWGGIGIVEGGNAYQKLPGIFALSACGPGRVVVLEGQGCCLFHGCAAGLSVSVNEDNGAGTSDVEGGGEG